MHKSAQLLDRLPSQRRAELGTSEVSVRAGQSLGFCVAYPTIRGPPHSSVYKLQRCPWSINIISVP